MPTAAGELRGVGRMWLAVWESGNVLCWAVVCAGHLGRAGCVSACHKASICPFTEHGETSGRQPAGTGGRRPSGSRSCSTITGVRGLCRRMAAAMPSSGSRPCSTASAPATRGHRSPRSSGQADGSRPGPEQKATSKPACPNMEKSEIASAGCPSSMRTRGRCVAAPARHALLGTRCFIRPTWPSTSMKALAAAPLAGPLVLSCCPSGLCPGPAVPAPRHPACGRTWPGSSWAGHLTGPATRQAPVQVTRQRAG